MITMEWGVMCCFRTSEERHEHNIQGIYHRLQDKLYVSVPNLSGVQMHSKESTAVFAQLYDA